MSPIKKKGLGRGLSALFGDDKPKDQVKALNQTNLISISDLSRNPYQPRQNFKEEKLEELANSIRKNGVIQPIAVRPNKSDNGKFEIVAGERRWLAAQRAGLHEIPVTILDLSDVESLEVAIVENIQRDDLNPIEEARGYKRLNEEFKYDHESISKLMSRSRSHISNTLRLLTLPSDVIAMLEEIKTPENASSFLDNAIKNKSKIMGFGHREYKVKDPRAIILQKLAEELFIRFGADEMYEVAKSLEAEAIPRLGPKGIFPNVDFYSGLVYRKLGIPRDLFTPIFAISRVAGWLAHWREQLGANRIFRPSQIYTGSAPRDWISLENRK